MGSSWITGAFGYVVLVLTWLNQALVEQGMPQSGKEWMAFGINNAAGLIGIFAKDFNKSNAPVPQPTAHKVE